LARLRRVPSLRDYNPGRTKTRFAQTSVLLFRMKIPAFGGTHRGFWVKSYPSPVTQPERSGRFAKQAENCPSAASFFPPAKRLRSAGYPQGKEPGRLFLPTLFWRVKRVGRRAGTQPRGLAVHKKSKNTYLPEKPNGSTTKMIITFSPRRPHLPSLINQQQPLLRRRHSTNTGNRHLGNQISQQLFLVRR
jgi:hypothetical protein